MKNLYKSILNDIDDTLDKMDSKVVLSILFGNDIKAKASFRDSIYTKITSSEKRISRRSQFIDDVLYIQFMNGKYDKTDLQWGFRIGTCNVDGCNDIVAMPNLHVQPALYSDSESEFLRLDKYLQWGVYKLPKDLHWLYYDIKNRLKK